MLKIHRNLYDAEQNANAPAKKETHEVKSEQKAVVQTEAISPGTEVEKPVKEKTKKRKKAKKEEV